MGLLDDAIREHLELKRRGGADPGEVAWEEQDALGSVTRDDRAEQGDDGSAETDASTGDRSFIADAEPAPHVEPSTASQETVEINMEAELSGEADSESPDVPRQERATPVTDPAYAEDPAQDSLEWEVPGEPAQAPTASGHDDHRHLDGDGEDGEHVEDVLEETPDFLRETPEQERLWFEQRPPRDFDFNE
jgi:hypothetical protein